MRPRLGAIAASVIVACGSFEATNDPPGGADAGSTTEGGASDGGGGDGGGGDGALATGCAAVQGPVIFCSDFDSSNNVEQATHGLAKIWQEQRSGTSQIGILGGDGVASSNALSVSGQGSAPFVAQVQLVDVPIAKNVIHLKMKLRVRSLPTNNDVYIAGLNFTNITFGLALHADGTIGLAQTPIPGSLDKSPPNTGAVTRDAWTAVELYVDRNPGKTEIAPKVGGIGGSKTLAVIPTGNAEVTIGMGYCDVNCGTPQILYDDVVLTEE